ncbi:ABC transporter ATP-binding protein [Candidatus Saccharibacteria bacterium]|nr:ABC transporter ATP-binding protein [Candidatus Saccharibacteria bacterium]
MFKLFKYLKPYWWQIILLLIMTGGQAFCTLMLPSIMADIINNGIVPQNTDYIWQQGLIMLAMTLFAGGCSLGANYFSAKVGADYSRDVRAAIYIKVLAMNLADTKDFSTASLINRTTNDVTQVQRAIMIMLSLMLFAPMMFIFAIIMAIKTAAEMSWIIVVGVTAIVLTATLILSATVPKFKIFQNLIDRMTLITRENLTGLRVIRAFDNEKTEKEKFTTANNKITKLMKYLDGILELMGPVVNFIFNGTTLLCSWVGISLLGETKNYAYIGNMSAFAQYVSFVMMSFLMLTMLFVMLPRANVCAGRINEVLKIKPKTKWPGSTKGIPQKSVTLEFKNVSFSYPDAEEKVLSNISFKAAAGETVAFIGSTGSGKSTLINLVPRFYEATEGDILVSGISIKDYEKDDLISRVGLVPQKGVLFAGTVASNIKFGAPNASEADIKEAAKIAQADSFIQKMPGAYDAKISQGGTNVSGGQKQRLSIARAIAKKPDIYIFDDAFSALDMKTDARLREALKPVTKDSVTIIVAQRASTIKNADEIIVLENGKAVGKGKHYELLSTCPVYQSIVKSQLSDKEYSDELKKAKKLNTPAAEVING